MQSKYNPPKVWQDIAFGVILSCVLVLMIGGTVKAAIWLFGTK